MSNPYTNTKEPDRRTFFGHPLGLANLAGVEMWERFSFYGMQAILAFYLYYSATEGGLGLPESTAVQIVGAYGGVVYLSAILGAWLSDRIFGPERTLTGGAVLIMIGHLALAVVPGFTGVGIGLICVSIGSGTLKATTSSVLGDLYSKDDVRRDGGFSIYYMGVNIGGLVGPLLTGWLWGMNGFHWGFGAAAVGMAIGLTQYLLLRRFTLTEASSAPANPLPRRQYPRYFGTVAVVVVLIVVLAVTGVIRAQDLATIVAVVTVLAAVVLFGIMLRSKEVTSVERDRVISFIPMFVASVAFWTLFQQQFTAVALYAEKRVDREFFGWEMSPAWVTSFNPIFIIILAGFFAAMWTKLGSRAPGAPMKFAIGTALMGVAFLLFLPVANGGPGSTPLWWLAVILLFFTIEELCLSPVGQSLSTKLAPEAFHTQMVALFFLSVATGSSLAGVVSSWYDETNEVPYFLIVGLAAIAVGLVVAVLSRWTLKKMHGVR
jgi:POT family proton-dependent oligopeptide transporter